MIANGVKTLWAQNRPVINGWLAFPDSFAAEVMAEQGFDSLTIDLQHGLVDSQAALPMLQAVRASGVTPLVRTPWLEPAPIMKALDAGAYGVICPMISTRAQAEALVSYVRYPPRGMRSFGPTRALYSAGADYAVAADDAVICLAMIETQEGVDNLDDIAATPGLDGLYIGPADLSLGIGGGRLKPGLDREEAEMVEAIQRILSAAHNAGIRAGIHCGTPAYAARAIGWGFDLVSLGSDVRLLASAAHSAVAETRRLITG